jgi:tape measure domain-containing protein
MATEKRSIIYELLVEAKGARQVQDQLASVTNSFGQLGKLARQVAGPLAGVFTARNIVQSIDEMTKFNQQLAAVGVTGKTAADGLAAVQTTAIATGRAVMEVGAAYQSAIQLQGALGRSVEDAARTTDAFVRVAAAEGKTAAEAAQQIDTLTFALDSGAISHQQFVGLLKQSNTFQRAAQEALGMTTAELVKLAKESGITQEQLTKIVFRMEEIGQQTQAAETVDSLTGSIRGMFDAFSQGLGQSLKGPDTAKLIDPDAVSTAQKLRDLASGAGQEIGGLAVAAKNSVDLLADGVRLSYNMLTGGVDDVETARSITQAYTRDLREFNRALEDIRAGSVKGSAYDPNYNPERIREKRAQEDARDQLALVRAQGEDLWREIEKIEKKRAEIEEAAAEKRKQAREREAQERARERADIAQDFYNDLQSAGRESDRRITNEVDDLVNRGIPNLEEAIGELTTVSVPEISRSVIDQFEEIEAASYIVEDALAGLFSGGIRSAREFFATILQGLSNMFAQLAAKQAQEGLMQVIGWVANAFSGGVNATNAGLANTGSGTESLGWIRVAKGAAFDRGRVVPFARGGIVSAPTVFPMASGGVGLMGEAGPEAVVPLRRTQGGQLGVASAAPNITIVNGTGVNASARVERSNERMTVILEAAQLGANMAEARMTRSMRQGYGPTAQSLQGTYGLRRRT